MRITICDRCGARLDSPQGDATIDLRPSRHLEGQAQGEQTICGKCWAFLQVWWRQPIEEMKRVGLRPRSGDAMESWSPTPV